MKSEKKRKIRFLEHWRLVARTASVSLRATSGRQCSIHVAVGLLLDANICEPHQCPCGAMTDAKGLHGLSCKGGTGRSARHHRLNDLVWRALGKVNIPSVKEPSGLSRSDGKRPDGLTLIPWKNGRCVTWDVTVTDTLAQSYLSSTSITYGGAAEAAADRKTSKYSQLAQTYIFVPIAMESLGPLPVFERARKTHFARIRRPSRERPLFSSDCQ